MPNHLSPLGIVHTVISILALIAGLIALFRAGKIDPWSAAGKWYVVLTILTCLTSFGIMKTGHLTPAHGLSVLVLLLLLPGIYARRWFGRRGETVQVVLMSLTLMLSFVPAITETLTRLPIAGPIAASPDASVVKMSNGGLFVVFLLGLTYQLVQLRKHRKA
jgi:uncharacterized membrane protein